MSHAVPTTRPPPPPVIGSLEQFLAAAVSTLTTVEDPAPRGPGRPLVLSALSLWTAVILTVLHQEDSQRAVWRRRDHPDFPCPPSEPVTDEAVRQRLAQASTTPLEELFTQVSTQIATRLQPYREHDLVPWAPAVVAIDQTTLDQVARTLPALRGLPPGDDALLPGELATVFDIRLQQWRSIHLVEAPHQNEKGTARDLLADLPRRTLILADLGYVGFKWFDDLTDQGYFFVSRLRQKTSWTILHTVYKNETVLDVLVWLGAHRADHAKYAVRLIQVQVGPATMTYITNVLDPRLLAPVDLARVYARRWDIELAFNLAKTDLHLHLLWSAKRDLIQQQVGAVLIIAQSLPALRQEIAGRAGVDRFEVSMPVLVRYVPQYAEPYADPIAAYIQHGRHLLCIRPSTRTAIGAPLEPLDQIVPLPPDLVRERTPRYAKRKCDLSAPTA